MISPIPDKYMVLIQSSDRFSHYLLQNESGSGHLLVYNVLPGLQFVYSNLHLSHISARFKNVGEHLMVLHCHNGNAEWERSSESDSGIFEENGLMLLEHFPEDREFHFPLHCYHGIAVVISTSNLSVELTKMFEMIGVHLGSLIQKTKSLRLPFALRADDHTSHVFSELYHLPKNIRFPYFKIKTLELILFLSRLDSEQHYENSLLIPNVYQKKMAFLREFLRENVDEHYTLDDLAKRTEMSSTQMKKYFKLSYGTTIYSYLKTYRMKIAVQLLAEENASVSNVAAKVGYTNSSKFAHAFKEFTGCTPKEYRNKRIR